MIKEIKNRIEKEIPGYCRRLQEYPSLNQASPLLFRAINEFTSRKGKRLRPILFVIGYRGFSKSSAAGLYTSAISIELLHDFMLVHDDIVDKSETRRGKPSMHKMFDTYLKKYPNAKFCGQDLAIIAGDVIYAMAIFAFLSIKENKDRKERALAQLINAVLYTGTGEFVELLAGAKQLEDIKEDEIYRIYDYKTAYYSFSSPLAIGAILAGADKRQVDILIRYGILLGRAFQIKDDILGIFGSQKSIGKSILTDLQEEKKTILIWHAYKYAKGADSKLIKGILRKKKITYRDLSSIRRIIRESGSLDFAKRQINTCIKKARATIGASRIKPRYKKILIGYSQNLLDL